jgi:hypothetical protein
MASKGKKKFKMSRFVKKKEKKEDDLYQKKKKEQEQQKMLKRMRKERKERKKNMRARRARLDGMKKEELMRWKEEKKHGMVGMHWCQMAEFRAAGPKNGPVKFLAA